MTVAAALFERQDDPAESEWLAARIGGSFFLESTVALSDAFGGDLMRGLVLLGIVRLNLQGIVEGDVDDHIRRGVHESPPSSRRKSTTIYAVAKALGLNYETTRRHVKSLVEAGYCLSSGDGYVAPASVVERPEIQRFVKRLVTNTRQMNERLRTAGLQNF